MSKAGQVYRLYDAWANPLYYGSSREVFGRLHTHASSREWYPEVSMILVDWYPSRLIALAVERELIFRDAPWYNHDGITHPWQGSAVMPDEMPPLPEAPDRVPGAPSRPVVTEQAIVCRDDDEAVIRQPSPPIPVSGLVGDLYRVFADDITVMSSAEVVAALCELPDSDYAKRFTVMGAAQKELATALRVLGIRPVRVRFGTVQVRGYRREQLAVLAVTGGPSQTPDDGPSQTV